MSTTTLEAARRPMSDAVGTVRTLLSLPASFEHMSGNVGAVVVPVPQQRRDAHPGMREVLIGDPEGLLTYYGEGSAQTVEAWQVCGYFDQDPRYSEEVPVTAGPHALAAAVRRAYLAARDAR